MIPSGYGEGPKIDWLSRAKPWPISRMVRMAGQAAEEIGVDPGRDPQPPGRGDAHDGDDHAQGNADDGGRDGDDQGVQEPDSEELGQDFGHCAEVEKGADDGVEPVHGCSQT